jgi:hypothetical protein
MEKERYPVWSYTGSFWSGIMGRKIRREGGRESENV